MSKFNLDTKQSKVETQIFELLQHISESTQGNLLLIAKNELFESNKNSIESLIQLDELLSRYYYLALEYIYLNPTKDKKSKMKIKD